MGTNAQAFLDVLATPTALLRGETRGHSHHHMTGSRSLIREDGEKRAPTRLVNAFGKGMVLHHPRHIQVFHTDTAIPLGIVLGGLEVEVAPLTANFQVLHCYFPIRFAAALTSLLAATDRALRLS